MQSSSLPLPLLLILLEGGVLLIKADSENVIQDIDREVLKDIYRVFQDKFDKDPNTHGEQFAVLYYGCSNVERSTNFFLDQCKKQTNNQVFLNAPNYKFQPNQCKFIAGKLKTTNRHTEKIILWSFRTKSGHDTRNYDQNRCPHSGMENGNIYLFTYNSPCVKCDITIQEFVEGCGMNFERLIIGYDKEHKDVEESRKIIYMTDQVAMTKI